MPCRQKSRLKYLLSDDFKQKPWCCRGMMPPRVQSLTMYTTSVKTWPSFFKSRRYSKRPSKSPNTDPSDGESASEACSSSSEVSEQLSEMQSLSISSSSPLNADAC